ncbi:MAG: hypothetical protein JWM84_1830 [Nocardioides sp.]|nr:hypothetical protein [Nocardioides sp.]
MSFDKVVTSDAESDGACCAKAVTYLALAAVSYNMAGAVAASGIGETTLKAAIARHELIAHYAGEKGWAHRHPRRRP